MKSRRFIAMALLILCLLSGCTAPEREMEDWGSFTDQPVISSDGKYRAEHGARDIEGFRMIQVDVYDQQTDKLIFSFVPARARDFRGICWEENTHNIWTQSADIGIHCYVPKDGQWVRDEQAVRPASIVSRWDDQ